MFNTEVEALSGEDRVLMPEAIGLGYTHKFAILCRMVERMSCP